MLVFVLVCITLTFSSFVTNLTRTRKLVPLLLLYFGCLVTGLQIFFKIGGPK